MIGQWPTTVVPGIMRMSSLLQSIFTFFGKRAEAWVLLLTLCLYLPFMGEPVLRTTGDEKVYVAQALEMQTRGSWFIQTLAESPNYYKAPLHYILLRLGYGIFGTHSLWSALWMNLFGLALAATALTRTLRIYWNNSDAALWVGLGLILAPGVFAHSFASQMEVELVVLYALVLSAWIAFAQKVALTRWLSLWLLIGLGSWLKSPLHSVLLGLGILVALALKGQRYRTFLWSSSALLTILPGILLAASATLIPWLLDPKAYFETYILRETVGKGPNGVSLWQSLLPNLSYHMWPLAPLLVGSCVIVLAWVIAGRSLRDLKILPGTAEAFAIALPTFAFFAWHPYRSEIYSLPALPMILMGTVGLGFGLLSLSPRLWTGFQSLGLWSSLLPSLLVLALDRRFASQTPWWPEYLLHLVVLCLILQVIYLARLSRKKAMNSGFSLLVWVPAFISMAVLMKVLGEEDLKDLKQIAKTFPKQTTFGFYNGDRFVWSEWGLLNLSSGLPVKGLHELSSIRAWVLARQPLIVSNDEERLRVEALVPELSFTLAPWSRWASHGLHSPDRNPRLAWNKRDLHILRQTAYIMTVQE